MDIAPGLPPRLVEGDPALPNYVYEPLDSAGAEIRLLKVHFDVKHVLSRINAPPLVGTLEKYYLPVSSLSRTQRLIRSTRLPPFFALSYVWGDPARTHEIIIDGKRLGITENLHTMLRELQPSSLGVIRLWADAICICQDDLAERSSQVLLMREIYHAAADVKIWLGPSNGDTIRCLRFISSLTEASWVSDVDNDTALPLEPTEDNEAQEKLMSAILIATGALGRAAVGVGQSISEIIDIASPAGRDERVKLVSDEDTDLSLHRDTIEKLLKWEPPSRYLKRVEHENFREIADLIDLLFIQNCAWFERMWVVQELGVATDATVIAIGGRTVLWSDLLRCVCYLHYTLKAPVKNIRKLIGLEKIRQGWNDKKRQPLRDLIRECRYRRATDPKDKIFSLLGLMGDKMNPYLQPDYSKSVCEVYANTTLYFLSQAESLNALCGWQIFGRQEQLPSWVPDYSLNQDDAPSPLVPIDGRDSIYHASGHDHRSKYSATSVSMSHISWNKLRAKGLCIDLIEILSKAPPVDEPLAQTELLWKNTIVTSEILSKSLSDDLKLALEYVSSVVGRYREYSSLLNAELDASIVSSPVLDHSSNSSEFTLSFSRVTTLTDEKSSEPDDIVLSSLLHDNYIVNAYIQTLLSGRKSIRERLNTEYINTIMSSHFQIKDRKSIKDKDLVQICEALEAGIGRRRLIITRKGYIGAVPQETQPGDVICILFGCSVPVVMRKIGDEEYSFIGECYLCGFMDGEAIALQVQGQLKSQDFVLV